MQGVLSYPICTFSSETQVAPRKRYLDFKIWALKFSKKYIPLWQLGRSTLSKTISACLQRMTYNPKQTRSARNRNIKVLLKIFRVFILQCKKYSLGTFLTWVGFEIGINKSLIVTIDCSCHARPWLGNAERTRHITALYNLSLKVQAQKGWSGEQNRNSEGFWVIDLAKVTLLLTEDGQWRATGGEN